MGVKPVLDEVPQTMLWTLHDRVHEASRPGGRLDDPEAIRILGEIDYDFGRFGLATGVIGLRALAFDEVVQTFLDAHSGAVVVSLGEGLETQRYRVGGDRLWITVDLPQAIDLRERFIAPDDAHWHVRASATDPSVFDGVPAGRPTLVLAQGLFMYLRPEEVQAIVVRLAARIPGARLAFDVVPRWVSWATRFRPPLAPRFRLPTMPFGLDRFEVGDRVESWVPGAETSEQDLPFTRSVGRLAYGVARRLPILGPRVPCLVVVQLPQG